MIIWLSEKARVQDHILNDTQLRWWMAMQYKSQIVVRHHDFFFCGGLN